VREYLEYALKCRTYLDDVGLILQRALREGRTVLAEGAQGTLLDLDHGTYPFVTSSTPTAPGMLVGLGLGLGYSPRVIGVTKAFQTRVGEGPFPTELKGETARELRGTGENFWDEFGTTTGRPRRVGWLDGVLLRYAARINGLTDLVVTKLDILAGLDTLKICTGYQVDGEIIRQLPLGPGSLGAYQPVYEELAGWKEDVTAVRSWEKLPGAAQEYIRLLEETAGLPVKMISVGPERDQIIRR
jgi:adenylosuccinate synthase